jgi:hypothetical protein
MRRRDPTIQILELLMEPAWGLVVALIVLAAGLCACAAAPVIQRPASACSTLVPESWRQGVPSADLPVGSTAGDWIAFGDAQTGQLDKANDRTTGSLEIVSKCEARDAEVVKALAPKPWWKLF